MIKSYLAGFGDLYGKEDLAHSCKGYFSALKDEKVLQGEIITGEVFRRNLVETNERRGYETFGLKYGKDLRLWEMLAARAKKEEQLRLYIIRAEVDNTGESSGELLPKFIHKEKLGKSLVNLSRNYPSLEFFVYSSDIDAKS